MTRDCKNPRHNKRNISLAVTGIESRPPDRVNPSIGSVNIIGRKNGTTMECVSLQSNVNNGNTLLLLLDTAQV